MHPAPHPTERAHTRAHARTVHEGGPRPAAARRALPLLRGAAPARVVLLGHVAAPAPAPARRALPRRAQRGKEPPRRPFLREPHERRVEATAATALARVAAAAAAATTRPHCNVLDVLDGPSGTKRRTQRGILQRRGGGRENLAAAGAASAAQEQCEGAGAVEGAVAGHAGEPVQREPLGCRGGARLRAPAPRGPRRRLAENAWLWRARHRYDHVLFLQSWPNAFPKAARARDHQLAAQSAPPVHTHT